MLRETAGYVAAIYNAAYQVRYYSRGGRTSIQRKERQQAIRQLGLAIRSAFNESEDFEPLLVAVFDGLSQRDAPPF